MIQGGCAHRELAGRWWSGYDFEDELVDSFKT